LTNGCGYIKWINCSDVTTALWYTPYNSTNPNWYTSCTWTLVPSSLKTVNGCCLVWSWDICIQPWDESNTKMFCLTETWNTEAALATAQEIMDWYCSGKMPIISYCNSSYFIEWTPSASCVCFSSLQGWCSTYASWLSKQSRCSLYIKHSSGTASCIYPIWWAVWPYVIAACYNYSTPYMPTNPWNPATKKYVDECVVYKCSTTPSSPTEWLLWYDTSSDILKSYNWTQWNAVWAWSWAGSWDVIWPNGSVDWHIAVFDSTSWKIIKDWWPVPEWKTYTAGNWILIEDTYEDYSAMQWPAPSGYHVPQSSEWVALCEILTTTFSMASNATTMGTYLKMPMAGYRSYSSSNVNSQGSYAYYWSSSVVKAGYAYSFLRFNSSSLSPQDGSYNTGGFSLRCFKDSPTIPTSSWTTLFDGSSIATWAWIFHNAADWLISISPDWVNWITIQDKNLWATIVYNDWDTLSEANCWWYFQWWNNYMFPFTWTVTTSSTQVDASGYWPWNYYSSSTFITRSGSPYNWSSVRNDNLWWWVTWVLQWENRISNIWVISINWQTWATAITEFSPSNTWSVDQVLTKTSNWYEWQTAQAWDPATVVSWDTWIVYTIKVGNTAPAAGTPATTITFVT
jgi:hypothetical protein